MEINNLLKSNKLSIDEFKENLPHFLSIIPGILVSITCGFILANIFRLYDYYIFRVRYLDYYMILLYIFCNIFFGLILAIAISYGIKKHKYKNRKNLLILIVFCSFLIYFIFSIIFMCILFGTDYIPFELLDNTHPIIRLIWFLLSTLYQWPFKGNDMELGASYAIVMPAIIPKIHNIFLIGMNTSVNMGAFLLYFSVITVNTFFLFTQFLITIFCTWKYIIYTCPWLSPMTRSDTENKSWYSSLIKAMRRRTM